VTRWLRGTLRGAANSDIVNVALNSAAITYRPAAGEQCCVPADEVSSPALFRAAPWRTFRWYFGQRHYSGTYWSATEHDHVIYESRLELANLILADFDPTVHHIVAQPFQLSATVDQEERRHIPDYLWDSDIGPMADVVRTERMAHPRSVGLCATAGLWTPRRISVRSADRPLVKTAYWRRNGCCRWQLPVEVPTAAARTAQRCSMLYRRCAIHEGVNMASPFFIQSIFPTMPHPLVIDIRGASTTPTTPLDVWWKKDASEGWNNQLWTFVQATEINYWFLQNPASGLVIDVTGGPNEYTSPGTFLDANTLNGNYNQVWTFLPSEVENYYFIQSALSYIPPTPEPTVDSLVIDIQGNVEQRNTRLDVFTQKGTDWDNQLWTFVDENDNFVPPPPYVITPPHKIDPE
jgi:hypothetical protein